MNTRWIVTLGTAAIGLSACEGAPFEKPPIHLQQNMDFQKRFEPQEENPFYDDGRAMRPPVENTVARGHLRTDDHLFEGLVDGENALELPKVDEHGEPIVLDEAWLKRGQERYGIYCTPCHGFSGAGNGLAVMLPKYEGGEQVMRQGGMLKPTSLYDERLQGMGIGHFYRIITYGKNNMMPYAGQITVRDRWAIASYVRVLQRSRGATLDQVPKNVAAEKKWSE